MRSPEFPSKGVSCRRRFSWSLWSFNLSVSCLYIRLPHLSLRCPFPSSIPVLYIHHNTPEMSSIPHEKAHEDREKSGPEAEEESGSDDDSKHDSKNEGGNITPMKSLVKLAEEAVIKSLSKAVDANKSLPDIVAVEVFPALDLGQRLRSRKLEKTPKSERAKRRGRMEETRRWKNNPRTRRYRKIGRIQPARPGETPQWYQL